MFHWGFSEREGWFKSPQFGQYQRVNKAVYAYVEKSGYYYRCNLYPRGRTGYCLLEARSVSNVKKLFELAEQWLTKYGDSLDGVGVNPYNPFNRDGYWAHYGSEDNQPYMV